MKIGFVVLGFGNYPMFKECIDYLTKIEGIEDSEVFLVDNASPDGTGEKISEYVASFNNFHTVLSKENLGFAKGNNLGYKTALEHGCEVIVVMNSDVFIEDSLFINKLSKQVFQEQETAIIAPDIIGSNNRHSNPYRMSKLTIKEAKKRILVKKILYLACKMHLRYKSAYNDSKIDNSNEVQKKVYGIGPHGACIIFCPSWTMKENKAFYPGTFLYCEEFFLHSYALEKKYIIEYCPQIVVRHIGDASIDSAIAIPRTKRMFTQKNQISSLVQYIEFEKDVIGNWGQ